MNIIVVGCGRVGAELAYGLYRREHHVTVIDEEPNAFENALFLWEAAQQHACTTYQMLLQTGLMLPAVGILKQALTAAET